MNDENEGGVTVGKAVAEEGVNLNCEGTAGPDAVPNNGVFVLTDPV